MDRTTLETIHAPHDPLASVQKEMEVLGVPTIRAVYQEYPDADTDNCWWVAIEGSHRIAAANELDIPIRIVEVASDEVVSHDFQDVETPCTAREIVEYLESYSCTMYSSPRYLVQAYVDWR